jgi:hypothetical protein
MSYWSRGDLEQIHKASSRHRNRIEKSVLCGCFYCLATFPPAEVMDWIDGPNSGEDLDVGITALCPRCGIDSVLPDDVPKAPITADMLRAMHTYWFERTAKP